MGGRAVAGLIAMVLWAGCAGHSELATETAGPTAVEPSFAARPEFGDNTGALAGLITDEALDPLGNVSVRLLPGDEDAWTDGSGHFTISNVEPRVYTLYASRIGYADRQTRVEIAAGRVVEARLLMVATANVAPYHATQVQKGFIACAQSTSTFGGGAPNDNYGNCFFPPLDTLGTTFTDRNPLFWEVKQNASSWRAATFETEWSSTQASGSKLRQAFDVRNCEADFVSKALGYESGGSPLRSYANETTLRSYLSSPATKACPPDSPRLTKECNETDCSLKSQMYAAVGVTGNPMVADAGFVFQQPFTQYLTAFFHEPGDQDFTALADG